MTLEGVHGRRVLRLYHLYRVTVGLALVLLISSDLDENLLNLAHAGLFRDGSWAYLIINILIAILMQRPRHLLQVFSLAMADVILLVALFYAAGGVGKQAENFKEIDKHWEERTGHTVTLVPMPNSSTDQFAQYRVTGTDR